MRCVEISEPAQADIQSIYDWWRTHRSAAQAQRWYREIHATIQGLRSNPERCEVAIESEIYPAGLRQCLFGIGRRPTHRIVFSIESDAVKIIRVRHTSQRQLQPDDLS